jgi:hypothetical protein
MQPAAQCAAARPDRAVDIELEPVATIFREVGHRRSSMTIRESARPPILTGRNCLNGERGEARFETRSPRHRLDRHEERDGLPALGHDDFLPVLGPEEVAGEPVLQLADADGAHRNCLLVATVATVRA